MWKEEPIQCDREMGKSWTAIVGNTCLRECIDKGYMFIVVIYLAPKKVLKYTSNCRELIFIVFI